MKRPNFFILGAPKCGTTSLDAYLKSHPRIFTAVKEPHHFNTDDNYRLTADLPVYESLFADATDAHLAVGEASVRYLHSRDAVDNILRYNADAKFIVMARNPVAMAHAWHGQLVFNGEEDESDFAAAWALQDARRGGDSIPRGCIDVSALLYGEFCCVGEQLARVYERVSAARVQVVLFDDFAADPGRVYRTVLRFLDAPDDHQPPGGFAVHNAAKVRRNFLRHARHALQPLAKIKTALGIRRPFGLSKRIEKYEGKTQSRAPLSPDFQRALAEHFADDVRLLESLLGRDLSHWRAPA
ncbi:MAG: sulfotransferase [Gammaproteobacteria bacterium]|nr:sulfotransferase [Gammaproteobacteria bacterium]